jgi:MFS family permease
VSKSKNFEAYFVYFILFIKSFGSNFVASVSIVYLMSKGLDFFQINFLDSFYLVLVFLLEIPTGIIGDKFGHKVSFQVSSFLRVFYYVFLIQANSFLTVAIVFIILAISESCATGSFAAWYIKKMRKENNNEEHIKLFSNNQIIMSISGILAGLLGAILAINNIDTSYWIAAVILFVSAVLLLFVKDNKENASKESDPNKPKPHFLPDIKSIFNDTKQFLKSNSSGQWRLLLPLTIGYIGISGIDNFWQPIIVGKENDLPLWVLGYTWVLIRTATLLSGIISRSLRKLPSARKILPFFLVGSAIFVSGTALFNFWLFAALAFGLHVL